MNFGVCPPPPKRSRSAIELDLLMAEGRLTSLRKAADCLEPDSSSKRAMTWYATRIAFLERELEDLNRRP